MAQKPNPAAQIFARYVKDAARRAGYAIGQRGDDGEAKLTEDAQMSQADITAILNGQYEAPLNLLKPLATALGVEQKVLLRKAGILEGRTAASHQGTCSRERDGTGPGHSPYGCVHCHGQ
ncbi:helix-turn-helix transcriptional regulator [Streptomyces sp. NL15-2K]|uniref:helix-turn-helix transcriptional regulator n=1 Tax=Streptomyces sp. NL15-2K TaxID=376149 RepID=UPI000F57F149|nr:MULTISPECIES: helix-turn-helix transcriptional regulator [Actinomycetes]WKX06038.1 helix-turn-helix transcriptional regulator [Kutzneria buriramensis]GCB53290.1 hypothetical protein SNL152K_10647 [Streptomyces sp. NL15-2K]